MPKNKTRRPKTKPVQRRPRTAAKAPEGLWAMQPGGDLYSDWWHVPPGLDPEEWAGHVGTDGRLDATTLKLLSKVPYFAKIYGNPIPIMAACILDDCLEDGWIGLLADAGPDVPTPDRAKRIPLADLVPAEGLDDGETVRDCLHRLHADGLLIMECEGVVALGTPWYMKDRTRRVEAGEL